MRKTTKYIYETRMEVRDYECDIQGIVNNANYLHYTEHTRHRFIRSLNISFSKLHDKGVDPVVARMNLEYKTPLTCDDEFISRLALRKEGIRYIFTHDADVTLVILINGRLAESKDYDDAFAPFLEQK